MAAKKNLTDQLVDDVNGYVLKLLRAASGSRNDMLRQLDSLESDLIGALQKAVGRGGEMTAGALRGLVPNARDVIQAAYDGIQNAHTEDLGLIVKATAKQIQGSINDALRVPLVAVDLKPEVVRDLSKKTLIQGATSAEWWDAQAAGLQSRFVRAMRVGLSQNEAVDELVRRIRGTKANGYSDGIMQLSRNQAEALVRTSALAVSNLARLESIMNNSDLVGGVQWVATLDSRTTEICISLNGLQWKLPESGDAGDFGGYEPIDHDKAFPGPTAHWNCRSTQVPVMLSFKELAGQGAWDFKDVPQAEFDDAFKEKLLAKGYDESEVAKIMASADGQPAQAIGADEWLSGKTDAEQNDLLGEKKAELFRQGDLALTDITDQNARPIAPEQLDETSSLARKSNLETLPVESTTADNTGEHINELMILNFNDGTRGIFKPASGEYGAEGGGSEGPNYGEGPARETVSGNFYKREVAASEIADIMGLSDLVPATVLRDFKGEIGSLQDFVPDAKVAAEVPSEARFDGETDAARAAAFDYVIGNTDRHLGNWMLDSEDKIHLIDNGMGFPNADYEMRSHFISEAIRNFAKIPEDVQQWSQNWDSIDAALQRAGLSQAEIDGVERRLEELVGMNSFDEINIPKGYR